MNQYRILKKKKFSTLCAYLVNVWYVVNVRYVLLQTGLFTICHSVVYDLTDTSLSSNGMILNLYILDTCKRVLWQPVKIVFFLANSADPDGTLPYVYRYPE